jgi:hypothetical protein
MPGPTHAIIVTVDNTDSRGQVVQLIKGAGSILDFFEGRDPEPSDPTVFNRWVLKPSLLPNGTPEITGRAWMGLNTGVPAVVRNEYSQNTTLWRTIDFNGGAFTRDFMLFRLKQEAGFEGVTHFWHVIPGQSLAGDLLSKFVPIG